jgi:phosphoglycerate dehydrogenase-like enzyme
MKITKSRKTIVLFLREHKERLKEYLRAGFCDLPGVELVFPPDTKEETLLEYAPEADIIVGWRPTPELLAAAEKLRLFIMPGAGVQHLIEPFTELNCEREVTLVNGHGNAYFTAQCAVSLLLSLMTQVIPHHNAMAAGEWNRHFGEPETIPLLRRKVGLLGYGAVNRKVHRFLSGFDVEFAILRRDWGRETNALPTPVAEYSPEWLSEFLSAVDILIIAVPMTPQTEGVIGGDELALLGESGLLVNIARGKVVDEENLYLALRDGVIAGAALDVWYEYHPEADDAGRKYPYTHPFHELDNVVMSPHRAASPFSDLERWDEVIENIRRFADGGTDFLNIVDLERGY